MNDGAPESDNLRKTLPQATALPRPVAAKRIPQDRLERFGEVGNLLNEFGSKLLDAELTEFTLELWGRICRRRTTDCRRGQPNVWAASVVHVIARMNFLFDPSQPVHLTFDTIVDWFQVKKTTVGAKATEIEKALRLRLHSEPGLCRGQWIDDFTIVQLSNGLVIPLGTAKKMGFVPPEVTVR